MGKKKSPKKKGDETERKIELILKSRPDTIYMKSPRTMKRIWTPKGMIYISQANDFFGLFDFVHKNMLNETFWIQAKSNQTDVSTAKHKIEKFIKTYSNHYDICQIYLYVKRKGFVIYNFIDNKWVKQYINFKGDFIKQFKISGATNV